MKKLLKKYLTVCIISLLLINSLPYTNNNRISNALEPIPICDFSDKYKK